MTPCSFVVLATGQTFNIDMARVPCVGEYVEGETSHAKGRYRVQEIVWRLAEANSVITVQSVKVLLTT
jgi:hypothetical protein